MTTVNEQRNIVIGGYGEVTIEVSKGHIGGGHFIVIGRGGRVALDITAIQALVEAAEIYEIPRSPQMKEAIAQKIDWQLKAAY